MSELTLWTYDWVPDGPRGFVRDLRLRWACEEAGLDYVVRTVPFDGRETNHLERQPFGQVPFLNDGEVELFESGACLLHLAAKSETLMPRDPAGAARTLEWTIAALNSIEMVTVPWWFLKLCGDADLLMADVLRVSDVRAFGDRPATEAYVTRVTDRPAFRKARADQIALFEVADRERAKKA